MRVLVVGASPEDAATLGAYFGATGESPEAIVDRSK